MSWRSSLWRTIVPILDQGFPFLLERIARRSLPDISSDEWAAMVEDNTAWLRSHPEAIEAVDGVAHSASERSATLEAKVGGVLSALAVLTAVITGVAVAAWDSASWWERALFLISGAYSTGSLLTALAALRPRQMHLFAASDLRRAHRHDDPRIATAAVRLTSEEANTNTVIRLANLLDVAHTSARNAILVGLIPALSLAITHWTSMRPSK